MLSKDIILKGRDAVTDYRNKHNLLKDGNNRIIIEELIKTLHGLNFKDINDFFNQSAELDKLENKTSKEIWR